MTCLGEADLTFFSGIILDEQEANRALKPGVRKALHEALNTALESDPGSSQGISTLSGPESG